MQPIRIAVLGVLLLVSPSLAQVTQEIGFELWLGGDNGGQRNPAALVAYDTTGATNADDYYLQREGNDVIVDWAVSVEVTSPLADVNGAANLVFDLELHEGTAGGPLAAVVASPSDCSEAGWCSTYEPGENAAFAVNVDSRLITLPGTQGRIIDSIDDDGVNMSYFVRPSAAGRPAASTAQPGTLIGMGAGYENWTVPHLDNNDDIIGPDAEWLGIGGNTLRGDPDYDDMGNGPFFEGQINTSDLLEGTYVLVLKAAPDANNVLDEFTFVLPGDAGDEIAPFAVKAASIADNGGLGFGGDAIKLSLGPGDDVFAPYIADATSRRTQGAFVGDLPLSLDLASTTIDPRVGSTAPYQLVANFWDGPDSPVAVEATCDDIAVTNGTCVSVDGSGSPQLRITIDPDLPGSKPYGVCVGVDLSAVQSIHGWPLIGDTDIHIKYVQGDSNQSAFVDINDLSVVKTSLFQTANAGNYLSDVNASGFIDINDLSATKSNLFSAAPVCP